MEIIEKFKNTEIDFELNVYGTYDEPLFKVIDIAKELKYTDISNVILRLPLEFKKKLSVPYPAKMAEPGKSKSVSQNRNLWFINEGGLYYMAMRSKTPIAQRFQVWICNDVLPSIRKKGYYFIENKQVYQKLTYNMETEYDLHTKTIDFLRNKYPYSLFTATLGELQDTSDKRIKAYKLGYSKGSPDLIIHNLHKKYNSFVIEFKTPKGTGIINKYQSEKLKKFRNNNYKTLISNDYDQVIIDIIEYMSNTRIKCDLCNGKFKNSQTLKNHKKYIHRIKDLN